jgi:Domain of unknown function (DUF4349)
VIDEMVLEQLFDDLGQDIAVPDDGAERVVETLTVWRPSRRPSTRATRVLMVAAVLVAVVGIGLVMHATSTDNPSFVRSSSPGPSEYANGGPNAGYSYDARPARKSKKALTSPPTTIPTASNSSGTVDGAKIVKTGGLDLRVPEDRLRPTVNRVTGVAVGLGGYVSDSKSDYRSDTATAQVTIRVPVANFETATGRIGELPGVEVLSDSENGRDVTGQYTDLQAQLTAATTERDSLLAILADAGTIPDILAVHDRLAAVNAQVDRLQGQINLLNDQASLSSIAVSMTEKAAKPAAAAAATPPTGMSKAWKDARQGFSDSIEWIVARSGGALIVLLAALLLVFAIRYLYPVLRRALL